MNQPLLEIKNLQAGVENKQILTGINLTINPGEVHAVMGPNGSGKSTLARAIATQLRGKRGFVAWPSARASALSPSPTMIHRDARPSRGLNIGSAGHGVGGGSDGAR